MLVHAKHRHRIDKYLDTLLGNQPISDGDATHEATDREHSLITRLRLHIADPCTKSEVSIVSRCGDITWGVKF